MNIRSLEIEDFGKGFLDTVSALSHVYMTQETFKEVFNARKTLGTITLVAEAEDRIIGTASYFIELKFIHQGGKVMHVEDVSVKHDTQGKGIGKAIMDHLEYLAKLQGCYKMILNCSEKNVPFYEKCGFKLHESEMRKDLK